MNDRTATLTFTDGIRAVFSYTVDGNAQRKPVTRKVFTVSGTICD